MYAGPGKHDPEPPLVVVEGRRLHRVDVQVYVVGHAQGLVFVLHDLAELSEELLALETGEQRVLFGVQRLVGLEALLGVAVGDADVLQHLLVHERSLLLGLLDQLFEVADEGILGEQRAPSCWGCPR